MGCISMTVPKGYPFSAVLIINRVFNHGGHEQVRFLHSSLKIGMFLGRSHVFIIEKKINKSRSQIMFTAI